MKHRYTLVIMGWVLVLAALAMLLFQTPLTISSIALTIFTTLTQYWWGPLVYLSAYIVRPLLWLPLTIFSIMSGALFGLWPGLLITMLGTLISAAVAHSVGRYFAPLVTVLPARFEAAARQNYPYEFIASLHLTLLPFDIVNYFAGLARIPFWPFLCGVFVGMIPGTFTLTILGASINIAESIEHGFTFQTIDWTYLTIALGTIAVIWITSYGYRRYFRKRPPLI